MPKPRKRVSRIIRSISFPPDMLSHLAKRAKAESRSVNWLVIELIRKDALASK